MRRTDKAHTVVGMIEVSVAAALPRGRPQSDNLENHFLVLPILLEWSGVMKAKLVSNPKTPYFMQFVPTRDTRIIAMYRERPETLGGGGGMQMV